MKEETKHVTCPCCDGEIKWIKQFPLAQIISFEYVPLPSLVRGPVEDIFPLQITSKGFRKTIIKNPQIQSEVMQRLAQSNEFSYQGRVYEKVILMGDLRNVKEDIVKYNPCVTEEDIERSFGKEEKLGVRIYTDLTSDVKRFLSGQERTLKTLESSVGKTMPTKDIFNLFQVNNRYPTDLKEFSSCIREYNLGECVIRVESAKEEADIYLGYGPEAYEIGFSLEVAKFAYKGLFRER